MKKFTEKEILHVLASLKRAFPSPGAMNLSNDYKTLVGVILSARTRDEQVLKLLPNFFQSFPDIYKLANVSEAQIRSKIKTIGLNRAKARNLKKMAIRVCDEYQGKIPETMDDLITLGGVGRKTASVLIAHISKKPAIAVDTHVHRVTNRLGWVDADIPSKTEKQLLKLIPQKHQNKLNSVFVKHGRYICIPGKPRCFMCPIRDDCGFKQKNLQKPKDFKRIKEDIKNREKNLQKLRQVI